jgi:hypothetical protein
MAGTAETHARLKALVSHHVQRGEQVTSLFWSGPLRSSGMAHLLGRNRLP